MKQSTKLLSLVLALVMAFSCMTVIGNAALVKSEVTWDNIDDAQLTAEQVADLALDLVDNDLLAGMETIELSILGQLRLNKIDYIIEDICTLRDSFAWTIGSGLLGDLGDMDFSPLLQSGSFGLLSSHTAYKREHGDINVVMALLEFIGNDNNSNILSKVAYGIGGDGVSLGLIGSFLDLGDIGDMLSNIPLMLTELLYDLLIHGSYGYDDSVDDLKAAGESLPTTVDTLNEIANRAIGGLLTYPQDYSWEGEGDAAVKVWNEKSLLMPTVAKYGIDTVMDYFSVTGSSQDYDGDGVADKNSLFQLIDKLAPFAIYDLGIGALNNNLKKTLMEAVDVEFNEIDPAALPASVATAFEVDAKDGEETYVTYIAYDNIESFGSDWFYTTLESETIVDAATGEPVLDEDGNEQSEKVRKYFKANTAPANKFFSLIDFGWEFVAPEPLTDEATSDEYGLENLSSLNYAALIAEYGSIMESLNHLLYVVFETAVKQEVKDEFADMTGDYWVDGPTTECIMDNAERLLKYLLAEHADMIFGKSSPYVEWTYDNVADKSIVDIIAIMGPVFFEDVMPQLIMPKNTDGTYAFHEDVQILEFGAIVIREFMTEIAPNVNYDSYIFAEGNVKSANDRQFKVQDAETWYNIILNMGVDIGYTYLNNITNFNTAIPTQAITEDRWTGMLSAAITWAAEYVSDGTNSVIHGFEPSKLAAYTDPFDKLSYVLNTLLPLGFICGCTSSDWDFDTSLLFDKVKVFLTSFDLAELASLFGRNQDSAYNAFDDENLITVVLTLVNDIVNLVLPISENGDGYTGLLQGETSRNLDTVVSQANLKITVQQLLRALYTQGRELLSCALPVLGMFIKGWGTEQQFNTPQISLSRTIDLTNGATAAAVEVQVRNASNGVWRHYRDAAGNEYTDNQYQIQLVSVAAYDQFGTDSGSAYVTPTLVTTSNIDYGAYGTFTYTAANVPTSGALVRFEVGYKVYNEDGEAMANGKVFYAKSFAWLNYNPTNEGTAINAESESYRTSMYTPQYVGLDNAATEVPEIRTAQFWRENVYFGSAQTNKISASTATVDGITFGTVEIKPANANYPSLDLYNFKTYSDTWYDEDDGNGKSFSVAGGINEATWKAANKTPGSTSTWSVTLVTKNQTLSNQEFKIVYYDDIYQNKLTTLAADEMNKVRGVADYNLSGKAYADGLLTTANTTDDEGDTIFRETNYTETAWIAAADGGKWAGSYTDANGATITETVTTYAESAVADIATETDADGNVISATGTVTVDGKEIAVKKVTVIDCATAVGNYATAFVAGVQGGMQAFNDNMVFDVATRYEDLYVTSNDIDYCKKSTEQVINEGNSENIDGAVSALKTSLNSIEATYSDAKDYTDYKMYRWNRYNDARDDANYFINLQNDASNATVAEIDESFPYTWIEEDDLRALVSGDQHETYITALLEKLDEEEIKGKEEWLAAKKLEYASQTLLDVEMAANLLERVAPRLLTRDHGVITTYLADEIASADNMVGAESQYTARSWAKYIEAYNDAVDVLANPTQMTVFDAKYNLMISRNELVKVEDEADYSELEALIAQAQMVMSNTGLYDNTAREIGQVLAELGYHDFENANGDMVQLFPGSALLVNEEPYDVDEQNKIDNAATALKEALARLKFKGLNITGANVATETIVPADEVNGVDAITASVARIAPELDADAVKTLLGATATSANVSKDLITVSNDVVYTVDTDLEAFTGTNATVTFYTLVSGVKVPVATVKVVVEADVNGDGALDVLDGALTELTANEHAQLEGCYFIAANLDTATEEIAGADYTAVVNKILA